MVFSIADLKTPVCKVRTEGDSEEMAPVLEKALHSIVNEPYSKVRLGSFSAQSLLPIMRDYGYWKYDIARIESERMDAPECPNGASVKLIFKSGGKFAWKGVEWAGNTILSAEDLT